MYLIFDTSASKKPMSYDAPLSDTFAWPRMIHISWLMLDAEFKPIEDCNFIIKPDGFTLTDEACKQHTIDAEKANEGEDLNEVLRKFAKAVDEAKYLFAHNLKYNESIVGAEFIRKNILNRLFQADKYCLMHESTYYCKLPGKRGYKWPSLQELHSILFKQGYKPTHNARADVIAAAKCFIRLKQVRALEDIFADD